MPNFKFVIFNGYEVFVPRLRASPDGGVRFVLIKSRVVSVGSKVTGAANGILEGVLDKGGNSSLCSLRGSREKFFDNFPVKRT